MEASSFSGRRARRRKQRGILIAALMLVAVLLVLLLISFNGSETASGETSNNSGKAYEAVNIPKTGDQDDKGLEVWNTKPNAVKGVYVSGPTAGSQNFDEYIKLAEQTEVNALVIDVKEGGELTYPSKVPLAKKIGATSNYIPDLEKVVSEAKSKDIYTIARLAVFQDDVLARKRPDLAVTNSATGSPWENYNGVAWTNAYRKEVWKYNVAIAKEAADAGFDEIQFDYVRFPSDGPMEQLAYGKETFPTPEGAIAGFLEYAYGELHPMGVEVGADVFGLIGHNDNGGIGQRVSEMAPHLDVLCPMVYPSHYGPGSYGFPNPNAEPYGMIQASMKEFQKKARAANPDLELRPWIQDFTLGAPEYGPAEVHAQIQASYDLGISGWLLWNAGNEYTEGALEPEGSGGGPESKSAAGDQYATGSTTQKSTN